MKQKPPGNISEKELNGLLNEVFLMAYSDGMMRSSQAAELLARTAIGQNRFLSLFSFRRLDTLFLVVSVLICLNSLLRNTQVFSNRDSISPGLTTSATQPKSIASPVSRIMEEGTITDNKNAQTRILASTDKSFRRNKKRQVSAKLLCATSNEVCISAPELPREQPVETRSTLVAASISPSILVPNTTPVSGLSKDSESKKDGTSNVTAKTRKGLFQWLRKQNKIRKNGTFMMIGGRYGKRRN